MYKRQTCWGSTAPRNVPIGKHGLPPLRTTASATWKNMPVNAVWDYYCEKSGVPVGMDWYGEVKQYEKDVLLKRD